MKKPSTCFLLLLFSLQLLPQSQNQKIEELINAYVNAGRINGSVLVAQKGQIIFEKGYGYKNAADKTINDAHTIFQIGSVTKQFTSAVIMQLQDEKKLSVKDKLTQYFPGFPHGDEITIENLLTHTSGIYNYTNDTSFMKNGATVPHSEEQMIALFKDKPLNFEPGTKWDYSNSGYLLLGYIIEKVTGKPYEEVLRERIFGPIQMDHSGFDFTHLKSADKATGYFSMGKDPSPAPIVDSTAAFSAGAIYSCVEDLYKWDRALYTDKILTADDKKEVFTPYKNKYGYGWSIDSIYEKPFVAHSGGIYGFTSYIIRFPQEQTVIIVLDNSGSGSLNELAIKLAAIVFDKPYKLPEVPKEISVDESILKQYVGEYELRPNFILTISLEDGSLKGQATGQQKLDLFAESENVFFLKVMDAKIEFIKDENKNVTKLILHQGGKDISAKKIK